MLQLKKLFEDDEILRFPMGDTNILLMLSKPNEGNIFI